MDGYFSIGILLEPDSKSVNITHSKTPYPVEIHCLWSTLTWIMSHNQCSIIEINCVRINLEVALQCRILNIPWKMIVRIKNTHENWKKFRLLFTLILLAISHIIANKINLKMQGKKNSEMKIALHTFTVCGACQVILNLLRIWKCFPRKLLFICLRSTFESLWDCHRISRCICNCSMQNEINGESKVCMHKRYFYLIHSSCKSFIKISKLKIQWNNSAASVHNVNVLLQNNCMCCCGKAA